MRLTALLRSVLRSEGEFTTLGRELELVESYLDIERARFEQRLRVQIDVPPALRSLRVPPLILQPLVENAVKHGIAPQRLGGQVTVSARLAGPAEMNALVLIVHDTGAGVTARELRAGRDRGVGLGNIERRLACQYGAAAALSIESALGEGTTVEVRIPAEFKATELVPSGTRP
jgi:LytS/YehU family sensor histidine kinase